MKSLEKSTHTLKKSILIGSMLFPIGAAASEVFEPEKVREGSPQAEFIRQSMQESTGKILSQSGDLIEISPDDGKTWIEYSSYAGIALTSLLLAGRILLRKRRQNDLEENDDFLENITEDDVSPYGAHTTTPPEVPEEPADFEERELFQKVPQTDYLLELSLYREHSFSHEEIFRIFRRSLNNPWQKDNPSLYEALVELSFLRGNRDDFFNYYHRMIKLMGSEGKNIEKYQIMAKEIGGATVENAISEV